MKRRFEQLDFPKMSPKVVIHKDIILDSILARKSSTPPLRRHSISFDEPNQIVQMVNNNENRLDPIAVDLASRSILKLNSKSAPFHIRGRRKTVPELARNAK